MENPKFSVSQFVEIANQTLEYAFGSILIEGEVSSFKINQTKYIFFDLKDETASVSCFMMAFQLRVPVEDGMRVVVRAVPKITNWGKFSLTVQSITPKGEGSIKKSYQILKERLTKEGLFSEERKRKLPEVPSRIGVISSVQAAGYVDFMKILQDRWGGMAIEVAHVQVQGEVAADQIIRAIEFFNQQEELPEVLVLVRGGGSADDLAVFNDEKLVRAIAASRIPTVTGIGHEIDESLADLAADVKASTPTSAAQLIVPDKKYIINQFSSELKNNLNKIKLDINRTEQTLQNIDSKISLKIEQELSRSFDKYNTYMRLINNVNPNNVLARGYAVIRGEIERGGNIEIETKKELIIAEVKNVRKK